MTLPLLYKKGGKGVQRKDSEALQRTPVLISLDLKKEKNKYA